MKTNMKSIILAVAAMAVIAGGCSKNEEKKADIAETNSKEAVSDIDIRGQWYIENIVFNDTDYVRPDEYAPGVRQYIVFEDSTYFVITNCNSISGSYDIKGDSIMLGDGAMTEMACDNMATEDALRRIIPDIRTIDVQSDTVVRLNGVLPAECILLRKATTEIK